MDRRFSVKIIHSLQEAMSLLPVGLEAVPQEAAPVLSGDKEVSEDRGAEGGAVDREGHVGADKEVK